MTMIDKVYCVPKTEEELRSLPFFPPKNPCRNLSKPVIKHEDEPFCLISYNGTGDRTEIPVSRFLDLVHDRIVPWRLEEVGFVKQGTHPHTYYSLDARDAFRFLVTTNGVWLNGECLPTISTFTKLLTLVQFLTLPANNA